MSEYVRLKPARAKAYGFDPSELYRVVRTYTRPGYKALWAELEGGAMIAPLNKVKANELVPRPTL